MRPFYLLLLLSLPLWADAQCCCCAMRDAGQVLYDQGRFKEAIEKWEAGKGIGKEACIDAQKCPELDSLIRGAKEQKARTEAE